MANWIAANWIAAEWLRSRAEEAGAASAVEASAAEASAMEASAAEAGSTDARAGGEVHVLVIQDTSSCRQRLSEALAGTADPTVDLDFVNGLSEVADKLASKCYDLAILDVERCLPAQLFWSLNPEHWRIPVAVLQSGLPSQPGEIPCEGNLVLLRRAVMAAIRQAVEPPAGSGTAAGAAV